MNKIFTFLRESQTARFFIPFGIVLIVFGVFMFIVNNNNQNYIKVAAVVTKTELAEAEHYDIDGNIVEATYSVYVKYTVDGNEYEEELGEFSGYKEGQKINIYYNPENPSEITQTKSLVIPLVMIVVGVIAFIGGIISGLNAVKRYKQTQE